MKFDPDLNIFTGPVSSPVETPPPQVPFAGLYNPDCWLAQNGRWDGPGDMPQCEGRLRKCHLIPQQMLTRELPKEVAKGLVWDERIWVWGCGGSAGFGNCGHHGHFDSTKKLRVPRVKISTELEDLCKQLDRIYRPRQSLVAWLDRTYARRGRHHPRGTHNYTAD